MRQKSVHAESPSERLVKDIRRVTRKRHSAEEKIRIVLDGLRGESSIAELCRREGIAESLYYAWSKEFLEAGQRHLAVLRRTGARHLQRQSDRRSRPMHEHVVSACPSCVDGSELARTFFTLQAWSVQPCVRPLNAVHTTAGHNALRGSGPKQLRAFDNA